jgi:hypothetical protein
MNFSLDIQIRFGMGLPMKQNYTHPARCKTIDQNAEVPSPFPRVASHPGFHETPRPARTKKEPEWQCTARQRPSERRGALTAWGPEPQNLTLDELKSWLEEAKLQQAGAEFEDEKPQIDPIGLIRPIHQSRQQPANN